MLLDFTNARTSERWKDVSGRAVCVSCEVHDDGESPNYIKFKIERLGYSETDGLGSMWLIFISILELT